jgi:integrase
MKGNIYTSEKCPLCKGKLRHDENRNAFTCEKHPGKAFPIQHVWVKFGRDVRKRFKYYKEAAQFLAGLRYKSVEGTFDARDYKSEHPLGFETQALKWLQVKKQTVKLDTWSKTHRNYTHKAIQAWGQKNVKTICYGDIEDFLFKLEVGNKTRHNAKSVLHDFFAWLSKREGITMPEFPQIDFELGWRNTVTIHTQQQIIDEVKRITSQPKIWLGIRWLATYISIRPNEMRHLQEKHIDNNGAFVLPNTLTKEKKTKIVPMLKEDIEIYRSFPSGFPDLYFFRHDRPNGSAKVGDQYSNHIWYKWWKKACKNLGIENVDMYGGTRHSTVSSLGDQYSPEELKHSGTMHSTNKAFERYFRAEKSKSIDIYESIRKKQNG